MSSVVFKVTTDDRHSPTTSLQFFYCKYVVYKSEEFFPLFKTARAAPANSVLKTTCIIFETKITAYNTVTKYNRVY